MNPLYHIILKFTKKSKTHPNKQDKTKNVNKFDSKPNLFTNAKSVIFDYQKKKFVSHPTNWDLGCRISKKSTLLQTSVA